MKIEIWSDIVCPFCYIGKRKFEQAVRNLDFKQELQVEWKSFQLQPETKTNPNLSVHENLAKSKGIRVEQAQEMAAYVTERAAEVGLSYNFDQAVVANTFRAHAFLHLAKEFGKQGEAKEILLKSYFTEGKNIDSDDFFLELAQMLHINTNGLIERLNSNEMKLAAHVDLQEAAELGIRGVPFFVFNRKYAISGAQDATVFKRTLIQAYDEWKASSKSATFQTIEGEACDIDGNC